MEQEGLNYVHQKFYFICLTGFRKQLEITHRFKHKCTFLTMNSLVRNSAFHMNVLDDVAK